jgi:hypothetical protein
MEINSFGYSVSYIDTNNLVQVGEYDFRIFDLNYLTKHRRPIKNTHISNEIAILAPELSTACRAF